MPSRHTTARKGTLLGITFTVKEVDATCLAFSGADVDVDVDVGVPRETRQAETRQDKTRQDKTRRDKTRGRQGRGKTVAEWGGKMRCMLSGGRRINEWTGRYGAR